MGNKLVYGIGINDADYVTQPNDKGNRSRCQFYRVWTEMIRRCYSQKHQSLHPTYKGCSVAPEWLSFMCFKGWMETQNWQGMQLDKDLIVLGNKIYSQENCVFISRQLNMFTTSSDCSRGEWPLGVHFNKGSNCLMAQCNNPFTGKKENLGYFATPEEAHEAWRKRKHELACVYADQQTDPRIAKALRERFVK